MLKYPVTLAPDTNGSVLASVPDLPWVNSVGESEGDALRNVIDAIRSALEIYFSERMQVPLPTPPMPGQRTVSLPTLESAKLLLWNEMLSQNLKEADLAQRLNVQAAEITLLFDLNHASRLDFVEQAARALGKSLELALV